MSFLVSLVPLVAICVLAVQDVLPVSSTTVHFSLRPLVGLLLFVSRLAPVVIGRPFVFKFSALLSFVVAFCC